MSYPPKACPTCKSDNVFPGQHVPFSGGFQTLWCHDCGTLIDPDDLDWDCPHCGHSHSNPTELCSNCNLNPHMEYSTKILAPLWKKGSLRRAMERGKVFLHSNRARGHFLRTECGPHCPLAVGCKQDLSDFFQCCREAGVGLETVQSNRGQPATAPITIPIRSGPNRVLLRCAGSGWLAQRMYETNHRQPDKDHRSGS